MLGLSAFYFYKIDGDDLKWNCVEFVTNFRNAVILTILSNIKCLSNYIFTFDSFQYSCADFSAQIFGGLCLWRFGEISACIFFFNLNVFCLSCLVALPWMPNKILNRNDGKKHSSFVIYFIRKNAQSFILVKMLSIGF
jgi:hypothetical protein